jgi:hypothetical protein
MERGISSRSEADAKRLAWESNCRIEDMALRAKETKAKSEHNNATLEFEKQKWREEMDHKKLSDEQRFTLEKLKVEKDAELRRMKQEQDYELEKMKLEFSQKKFENL